MSQSDRHTLDNLSDDEIYGLLKMPDPPYLLKRAFHIPSHDWNMFTKNTADKFQFETAITSTLLPEHDLIFKTINIGIKQKILLADFSYIYVFTYDKNFKCYSEHNGEYKLDPRIDYFANFEVLNTSRGIVSQELQGTPFRNTVLPLIKPL